MVESAFKNNLTACQVRLPALFIYVVIHLPFGYRFLLVLGLGWPRNEYTLPREAEMVFNQTGQPGSKAL